MMLRTSRPRSKMRTGGIWMPSCQTLVDACPKEASPVLFWCARMEVQNRCRPSWNTGMMTVRSELWVPPR